MPGAGFDANDHIIEAIRKIIRAFDLHSRRLVAHCGLTGPQLAVLYETSRLKTPSAGSLAKAVHLSQATVTGILDRLGQRGLIMRTRGVQDRRSVIITVTAAGQAVLDRGPSLLQDHFKSELAKLEIWERTGMLSALQRIAAMMDADRIEETCVPGAMPPAIAHDKPNISSGDTAPVHQHSSSDESE